MKATRRSLDHDDAVQLIVALQNRYYALWGGRVATSPVDLNVILRTLTEKKIPFVLTGAHGIGAWTGRPRSTQDVDILVKSGRNLVRAVNAIKALYPELEMRNLAGVMAFSIPGERESVIDVTYPHRADLQETLSNPTWTENKALGLRYRVPSLEEALANKYGAIVTPIRAIEKRMQDAVDFAQMVKHADDEGQKPIDLQRLEFLEEKVWSAGGGKELLRLVEQVKAGKAIHIDSMRHAASQGPEIQS